jgi:3-isopropylmalate/(R)-2-methylmalate dehydratase small subunit
MDAFTNLTAAAVPLDLPNIDTDRLIPARFLRKPKEAGLGAYFFHDVRFNPDGSENGDFILNQAPYRGATILVTAENFGCGSSRESAVWALMGAGFRCVVGPSFGDIFLENCFKNGVLAVVLPADAVADVRRQLHARPGATISVDLAGQTLTAPDGRRHRFEVDPFRKQALLRGQDEIALTLEYAREIEAFEARRAAETPWLSPRPREA